MGLVQSCEFDDTAAPPKRASAEVSSAAAAAAAGAPPERKRLAVAEDLDMAVHAIDLERELPRVNLRSLAAYYDTEGVPDFRVLSNVVERIVQEALVVALAFRESAPAEQFVWPSEVSLPELLKMIREPYFFREFTTAVPRNLADNLSSLETALARAATDHTALASASWASASLVLKTSITDAVEDWTRLQSDRLAFMRAVLHRAKPSASARNLFKSENVPTLSDIFRRDSSAFNNPHDNAKLWVATGAQSGRYLGHFYCRRGGSEYYPSMHSHCIGIRKSFFVVLGLDPAPAFQFAPVFLSKILEQAKIVEIERPIAKMPAILREHPKFCHECAKEVPVRYLLFQDIEQHREETHRAA